MRKVGTHCSYKQGHLLQPSSSEARFSQRLRRELPLSGTPAGLVVANTCRKAARFVKRLNWQHHSTDPMDVYQEREAIATDLTSSKVCIFSPFVRPLILSLWIKGICSNAGLESSWLQNLWQHGVVLIKWGSGYGTHHEHLRFLGSGVCQTSALGTTSVHPLQYGSNGEPGSIHVLISVFVQSPCVLHDA